MRQWFHDGPLLWICIVISIFVLGLLLWVILRYNSKANPVPSKTSHNTMIEIVWTLVPVLILVGVAVPSIDLLAKQFKPLPAKTLTIKATGNQWFWTYTYPDNGGFEVISNMLPEDKAIANGEPGASCCRFPHGRAGWRADPHASHCFRRDPCLRRAFAVVQDRRGAGANQREDDVCREARRLLWPVFRAVRRAPWLYADHRRGAAAPAI